MKDMAVIKYMFMFDPSEAWSNLHQFENQLVKYFHHLGLEARLVTPIGSSSERVVFLSKLPEPIPEETEEIKSPKEQADKLRK